MNKDGTIYLALIIYPNKVKRWELIHWGIPCGLSDVYQRQTWCLQNNLSIKDPIFDKWIELDKIEYLLNTYFYNGD